MKGEGGEGEVERVGWKGGGEWGGEGKRKREEGEREGEGVVPLIESVISKTSSL